MILPGCTRGHIRARYVLQGYLIRNLMFGQRWAFLLAIGGPFFFFGAIGGPFFFLPSVGFLFFHRWAFFSSCTLQRLPRIIKKKAAELYQMRL